LDGSFISGIERGSMKLRIIGSIYASNGRQGVEHIVVSESGPSEASDGNRLWDRFLGIVMGVFAGVLVAVLVAFAFEAWLSSDRRGDAAEQAELRVASDLRALTEALRATAAQGQISDEEVSLLVEELHAGALVRVERPPGALTVTLHLNPGEPSWRGSPSSMLCTDLTVALGATVAGGQGPEVPIRECRPGELGRPRTQARPPAPTSASTPLPTPLPTPAPGASP